jgi:hypothetical protein
MQNTKQRLEIRPSLNFHQPLIEASVQAVKTPGRGFVLTRFLLPFHRLEKEEPVRLEDKTILVQDTLTKAISSKLK